MAEFTGGRGGGHVASAASSSAGDMTLETVIELLTNLSDLVGTATDAYCEQFIKSYGLPRSPDLMQQFQGGMLQMSERYVWNWLGSVGVCLTPASSHLVLGDAVTMMCVQHGGAGPASIRSEPG